MDKECYIIIAPDTDLDDILNSWHDYIEYKSAADALVAFEEDQDEDNEDRLYQDDWIIKKITIKLEEGMVKLNEAI